MSVVTLDYLLAAIIFTMILRANAESREEDEANNHQFSPSTVYLQDVYTNKLKKITVNKENSPPNEEEVPSTNIPTHLVEFHPRVLKISRITAPPRVVLNSSYIKSTTSTENPPYTDDPEEPMKVIPIQDQPRGVLDILFPATRVKTFKTVFDSVKRLLSYTFRR